MKQLLATVIEPAPALFELGTSVAVHDLGLHPVPEKLPLLPHSQLPPPVYPVLQVTAVVDPLTPVIEPSLDLSELGT